MHRQLRTRRRPIRWRRTRDERGAVAILMALCLTMLVVAAGMALDFGLVRVDRQVDQSVADSAVLAGLHGLNNGDGSPHAFMGVCTAVRYLKANNDRFSGVNENVGWKNGLGASSASGCTSTALRNRTCSSTDKSSWAVWHWAGTVDGVTYDVSVQSAYQLGNLATSTWPDDHLAASSGDTTTYKGCDQLAVIISQSRKPDFGSLATSSDLQTRIRSVGRVRLQPGRSAPAMLLLKRTGCPVLSTGSSGGGSGTYIHVLGAVSTTSGLTTPGTIHADTDGTSCSGGSNTNIFLGRQTDGIVAYAAPLLSNPSAPDPAKPGLITSVAAANGISGTVIRDSLANVHGSSALNSGGTQYEVTGRTLVTRGLIDARYGVGAATLTGVPLAVSQAKSVFNAGSSGWTTLSGCSPTQTAVNAAAPNSNTKLYIDCTSNNGFTGPAGGLTIKAGQVFFNGVVNPSAPLNMPNASKVYVAGLASKGDAILIGNNASFGVNNASSNLTSGVCSSGQSASKATLFVKTGDFKETGGLVQLCRTTVFMLGGDTSSTKGGCLPSTAGTAPTSTPCPGINGGLGTGQFTQQAGSNIDWTAPDTLDQTLDSKGNPLATATTAWSDANGPEDLALWSESSSNTSSTYNMNGGGTFHVRGVFMVPNADPFNIGGGAAMDLTNAQYIVTSIALNGGTRITMSVDPNSAVTIPDLGLVGLIR
jgi:Flp pilus assembly protein TadG